MENNVMVEETQNVPLLRFPEFSGAWDNNKIGDITLKVGSGKTPKGGRNVYTDDGILFIRSQNILNGRMNLCDVAYITEKENEKMASSSVKYKDVLLNITGASIGRCSVYNLNKTDANVNQHVCIIRLKDYINSFFIQNYIVSSIIQKQIDSYQAGGNREGLNFEQIKNIKINIPIHDEQQKIADFLSVIDERIDLLKQKKNLLESYKKGVMQKLFSQEIRFKDENGNDFPEWENELFGNIYTFFSTNSYSRECLNMTLGSVRNIHYGDIHVKYKSILDVQNENIPFINNDINLDKISHESYCQNRDLVIADASENYADIGKSIEVSNLIKQRVVAGLHTILARPNKKEVVSSFGGYLMQSEDIKFQIKKIAQGTKVLGLSSKKLAEITLKLPSPSEQNKIANFLSAIDHKITAASDNIDNTKKYKKGLLQKMFV